MNKPTKLSARQLFVNLDDVTIKRGVALYDGKVIAKAVRGATRYAGIEHLANDLAVRSGLSKREDTLPYPIFETGAWKLSV